MLVGGAGGSDIMNGGGGSASNFYFIDGHDQVSGAGVFNTAIELVPDATVLLCTKCYDNPAVLASISVDVKCLPIQNGFDPRLRERAGPFEGIASFVSECLPRRTHTRTWRRCTMP